MLRRPSSLYLFAHALLVIFRLIPNNGMGQSNLVVLQAAEMPGGGGVALFPHKIAPHPVISFVRNSQGNIRQGTKQGAFCRAVFTKFNRVKDSYSLPSHFPLIFFTYVTLGALALFYYHKYCLIY
jgi:hypothetical protein